MSSASILLITTNRHIPRWLAASIMLRVASCTPERASITTAAVSTAGSTDRARPRKSG
jgi:hypothetical protein